MEHDDSPPASPIRKVYNDGDDEGECEMLNLPENIYTCAFVLAQNATPGMYSFFPHANSQMWVMWLYLAFIVFSQMLSLLALTIIQPPMATSDEVFVDCTATTSTQYISVAAMMGFSTPEECATTLPSVSFVVHGAGQHAQSLYRKATIEVPLFNNTFKADPLVVVLQLACCIWVLVHSYFKDFDNVAALLQYRDFSRWFVVWKGESLRNNGWTLIIPMTQWALSTAVVSISWCLICGYSEPVDIVLNSMALTFISEIAEVFAQPVLRYYSETAISGLDPADYGTAPIYYLVTEYDPANAAGYTPEETWYVLKPALRGDDESEMHTLAGLISDFRIRLNPRAYCRPNDDAIETLRYLSFATPPAMLLVCFLATNGFIANPVIYCFAIMQMALLTAFLSVDNDTPPRQQHPPPTHVDPPHLEVTQIAESVNMVLEDPPLAQAIKRRRGSVIV